MEAAEELVTALWPLVGSLMLVLVVVILRASSIGAPPLLLAESWLVAPTGVAYSPLYNTVGLAAMV